MENYLEEIFDISDNDEKRENANVNGNTTMGMMLHVGELVSKEYALNHLIREDIAQAHRDGKIYIHDLGFYPEGCTTCCQIDIEKLFKSGFNTGHGHLRRPNNIMSATSLAAIAVQSNQGEHHGGQSIPYFDKALAPFVLITLKKEIKKLLENNKYSKDDVDYYMTLCQNIIDKINEFVVDNNEKKIFEKEIVRIAINQTIKATFQAMEAFVHNMNTLQSRAGSQVPFSSINLGLETTKEGRLIIREYLNAHLAGLGNGETPIFPIVIFTLKDGINYKNGDPNYDLFQLAMKCSAKRLFPTYSFVDASFNLPFYEKDPNYGAIQTMGCRTRVMSNINGREGAVSRGNLSFTTINLPYLALESDGDIDTFFEKLIDTIYLVKDQLLERFKYQYSRRKKNFPFLFGQNVWLDADKIGENDNLYEALKHGTLSIGFIGLAECLMALVGKHHGEDADSQKLGLRIVKALRDYCDKFTEETHLNWSVLGTPAENLCGSALRKTRDKFGIVYGVTDKEYFTNSFHVPVYYKTTIKEKINIESPYHALCNAGHITYIECDGEIANNLTAFEQIIKMMKESNIGYGAINLPIDRDPICGYIGTINDICPQCGRHEFEEINNIGKSIGFNRIRRITGYLTSNTTDRWNNAKKAELKDRIIHRKEE